MNHKVKLSVLFLKEGNSWVGQCLEHDIAAQGKTFEDAKSALRNTIVAQMFLDASNHATPLSGIKPAPNYYKEKFEIAEKLCYTCEISDMPTVSAEVEDVRVSLA